jgi:LysR family transcriptional regulator, glycine cleavage system transcriptional activator
MAHDLLLPLTALRAFEAAALKLSFKAAASELSVTPTAISHQIRHLEEYIGVRLLERTPRTCRLTSAGEILLEAVTSGFSDIRLAVGRLRRSQRGSALTLSTTPAFLSLWLVPRMQELREHCPDLDLRFHASKALTSLKEDGIDVAIRYGEVAPGSSGSFVLQKDEYTPICSPALRLHRPGDLRRATLLHVDGFRVPRPAPTWARWCKRAGVSNVDTDAGPRFSDSLQAMQAAIAGQGVVLGSPVIVSDALSSGVLVRPYQEALAGASYYFVCSSSVAARTDVQTLRAWLQRSLVAPL